MSLVSVLAWTNPFKSALVVVLLNLFLLRFLFNQRPICGAAIVLLLYFIRQQVKQRFMSTVLVEPPDSENWVNLSAYDLEKSLLESCRTVLKTWVSLRSDHYLMWVVVSSVFWISLAKLATLISFPTMLFMTLNGGFVIVPILNHFKFEFTRSPDPGDPAEGTTNLQNDLHSQTGRVRPKVEFQTSISHSSSIVPKNDSDWELEEQSLQSQLRREGSASPHEPESLTPYGATLPNHDESSEDEFLFDPKHFDSNSSSTSNSFEHLHI